MITPEQIVGQNKIRDAKICMMFLYEHMTQKEIGESLGISRIRVGQVLYANRALLILDSQYEKLQRINHYKRMADEAPAGAHDKEYWLDKVREEVEGTSPEQVNQPASLNRLLGINN